jgi:RNA polymerase sigma-70 factor (ECF subfamily)
MSSEGNWNRGGGADFSATRWSVVLLAGQSHSPESADALEKLCRAYWYPLYAFVRRQGQPEHEAQDLTQAFFSRLLEKRAVRGADRSKGKFRSFLLASLKNFLANEWDRAQAQKRGGGQAHFSLDAETAEERYKLEPAHFQTPEKLYEQRWAHTVLEQTLTRLQREFESGGNVRRFELLKPLLTDEPGSGTYADIGSGLGMTEQAVNGAVFRLRRRFREIFREEIADTVANPGEVDDEIRHLFAALSP